MRITTDTDPPMPHARPGGARPDSDFDALAELFLGEHGGERGPAAAASPAAAPNSTPPLRLVSPPIEVAAPESSHPPRSANGAEQPTASSIAEREPAGVEGVEALILGHLPMIAGAWASRYAASAAERERRPIALARLSAGRVSIEVHGAPPQPSANRSASSLGGSIRFAQRIGARWMVRVDAVDEASLAGLDGVTEVTVLSGADEAAVVGAYKALKAIASMGEGPAATGAPTAFGLAIMGAGGERAAKAAARLSQAVAAFLERPLQVASPVERIGPLRALRLVDGAAVEGPEALLGALGRPPEPPEEAGPGQNPRKLLRPGVEPRPENCEDQVERASAPSLGEATGAGIAKTTDVLLRAASVTDKGADAALSTHVAGLRALPARCPYAESIEMAIDGDGGLHLLTKASREAVESLLIVAEWARAHARLLSHTIPRGLRLNAQRDIARHVFTDEPAAARRLCDLPIRVHLLAPVTVEGRTGWFCTALN